MSLAHKVAALVALARGTMRTSRQSGVAPLKLVRDYRKFRWATGASPREYFCYRMWDDTVPIEERVAFLTWAQRRPLEAFMNSRDAADLVRSKVQSDRLFREIGVPTPPLFGVWYPAGAPGDHPKALRTREALVEVLDNTSGGVVCKREYGGSGKFVRVFVQASGESLEHASGERWSIDRLLTNMEGSQPWLVQQRMQSHPEVARLIGRNELATIRFISYRRRDGRIFLIIPMLRLPATKSGLDNLSAGNVAVEVREDGTLGGGIAGFLGTHVSVHPLTEIPFDGFTVPHWQESAAIVRNAHPTLPLGLSSLGWDVALSTEGPVLLELNDWWGDANQQPGPRPLLTQEFLDYVEERGASHLLTLDRRRRIIEDHRAASRAARLTTSP